MSAYGNKCVHCGVDNIVFLSIDHIAENGRAHCAEISGSFYRWLKNNDYPKDNYQLLCFNCNAAKYINAGSPHHKQTSKNVIDPKVLIPIKNCINCDTILTIDNFSNTQYKYGYYVCRSCFRRRENQLHANLKTTIMNEYGGKCVCCGFDADLAALTIDHIDGTGNKERASNNRKSRKLYAWLKSQRYPKDNYQVLCWNCNIAKHRLGICPHKQKI